MGLNLFREQPREVILTQTYSFTVETNVLLLNVDLEYQFICSHEGMEFPPVRKQFEAACEKKTL